jgi:hypothetical protein
LQTCLKVINPMEETSLTVENIKDLVRSTVTDGVTNQSLLKLAEKLQLTQTQPVESIDSTSEIFPTRTLVWLALPPSWLLTLIRAGFPSGEKSMVTGDDAQRLLDSIVKASKAETDILPLSSTLSNESSIQSQDIKLRRVERDEEGSYWMTPLQRQRLIEQITSGVLSSGDFSGLAYLQNETAAIGRHLLSVSEPIELSPTLWRWASLAERANNLYELSDFFGDQIKDALRAARDAGQTSAPEVLRWLEAFASFVEIFGSSLEIALTSARREYEIFNRQAYDQRYLTSYLVRDEQDNALLVLLNQPDDENAPWALHYVGAGGVGKTMLMRHINAHLSPQHNLAIARIDFDYLNPDYPAKQPGLLLLGFAVELKKYIKSSEGFLRFEKQIRELHNGLQSPSNTDDFIDVQSGRWTYIIEAFVDELRNLPQGMRLLLILDTCEELVKLRPDGTLPQSVRVTFDILKEIHRLMPGMCVVFSGRRPLASEGYDWRLRDNDWYLNRLPKRDYLMLQEIRGFNYDEAIAFLSKYKTGKVPEKLFDAILTRSRNILRESAQPFIFEVNEKSGDDDTQTETFIDIRYNPFDLDLYAAWAVSEPDLDERKLIAGAHFYVKERIVERVNSRLKKLLPALLLLGRFDEAMLRELYGKDNKDFNLLFEELIDQEWIDTERSISTFEVTTGTNNNIDANNNRSLSVWAIDPNMRERLVSYYRAERFSELFTARERVAPLLSQITLKRDWQDLSISYFEATVQVLTELSKELAADWWEKVEAKLADTARWDWAYALTNQLLATGGVAELKDETSENNQETENILRPAILATHAAALIHIDPKKVADVWQEVKKKAHLHPSDSGKSWLLKRAVFGIFAADAAKAATPQDIEKILPEFRREITKISISSNKSFHDSQLQASIISAIEKIIECCERIFPDTGKVDKGIFQAIYRESYVNRSWATNLPDELFRFHYTVQSRLHLLRGDDPDFVPDEHDLELNKAEDKEQVESVADRVEEAIAQGLSPKPYEDIKFDKAENKQKWLDWRAPDDLDDRIKLEHLRGIYSHSENPDTILEKIGVAPKSLNTIDADRLASAILTLNGYVGLNTDLDINEEKIEASLSLTKKISTDSQSFNDVFFVNAHRAFPPYFIVALETQAMRGELSATIKRAVSISQEAERNKNYSIQLQTERLLARLAFHFRLRDERSVSFGEILTTSEELEDVKVRSMLDSLDGGILEQRYWRDLIIKADKRKQAALLHFRYRSSPQLLNPKIIEKAKSNDKEKSQSQFTFIPELPLGANIFERLIVFDEVEYELRKEKKTSLPPSGFYKLTDLPQKDFALYTLISSINEEIPVKADRGFGVIEFGHIPSSENRPSKESIKLTGTRRAAAIMLEEGTLLTIRNPQAALSVLRRASKLYKECKDTCGEFLTELTIAMHAIKINEQGHLKRALHDLEPIYNELIKSEPILPMWSDIELCVHLAEKNSNPTKIFADFFDRYTDDLSWRPILARLVYCLVGHKELDGKGSLTLIIKTWLRVTYARTLDGDQPLLPSDFNFGGQNVSSSKQKEDYRSHFWKYLSCLFLVGLFVGYFYLISGEANLLLISLGIGSCLFCIWWLRFFKLDICINTDQIPSNLNLPLSVGHNVSWQTDKATKWVFSFLIKKTTPIDQSSDNNYSSLTKIFNKSMQGFLGITKFRIGLLTTTLIFESTNSVAATWEAALGLSTKGFHKTRFMFRRMLQKAYVPRTGEMISPIGFCNWAADNALLDSIYKSWLPLAKLTDFQYSGCIPSNIKKAQNYKNVCILHLVGLPIETPSGMQVEIVASEIESQEIFNTTDVSEQREERIISVEKINQQFPNLRVCVVQLPPRLEEPRSLTNRVEVAKLRRFCADVLQSGVGAVILLPAVNPELSVDCLEILANFIVQTDSEQATSENAIASLKANKDKLDNWIGKLAGFGVVSLLCILLGFAGICLPGPIPIIVLAVFIILIAMRLFLEIPFFMRSVEKNRTTGLERWMHAVYNVQELIADKGHSNKDSALEMAFDVCFYLHDEFTWRIHK